MWYSQPLYVRSGADTRVSCLYYKSDAAIARKVAIFFILPQRTLCRTTITWMVCLTAILFISALSLSLLAFISIVHFSTLL